MSDSADAVREEVDWTEACMQQAYNYLHATSNCFAGPWSLREVEKVDLSFARACRRMSVKTLDGPGDIKASFFFGKFGFTFAT
jgi:hypothetical protein